MLEQYEGDKVFLDISGETVRIGLEMGVGVQFSASTVCSTQYLLGSF
jgi:hypothetical protein